jgi:hypothetical protein
VTPRLLNLEFNTGNTKQVQEIMNLPQDVWFAVVQAYFGG